MLIGLVGKPSVGKSTFFKAATLADVLIASYPFATIKPNHGVGHVKVDCVEEEFHVKCNPQKGYCVDGKRFVPIELLDVAGLVEGASEGKGLGNQFLDDLTSADALIHIVDASGRTDAEGKETDGYDPIKDIDILENELDLWYLKILKKAWNSFVKVVQTSKEDFFKSVSKQFSGLKIQEEDVRQAVKEGSFDITNPASWSPETLKTFARKLRILTKPVLIVANKIDLPDGEKNYLRIKEKYKHVVPCSADSELALREASKHGLIDYIPGERSFTVKKDLTEKQSVALEKIRNDVLEKFEFGTGLQRALNEVVFDLLHYICVFPGSANKLGDSKGNILPDCFLFKQGSTALDFAYFLHTDFGKNFIKAIDAKTKMVLGKDYVLKDRDAVEIISK